MSRLLDRLPRGAKVAIIRLRSLGDCVLTTPAVHLLKSYRPDLRIGIVVEDRFAPLFEGNPDLEAIFPPRLSTLASWRPKLVVNLHGGTRSIWLTFLSAAGFRAGFQHFRFRSVYNVPLPRAQEIFGEERPVHTAEHLASAMFYLGVPQTKIPRARLFARPMPSNGPYAVIHPVASAPEKAWPAEGFLEAAAHLRGLEPVFIGGPGDDLSAFRKFRTLTPSLSETMSLLQGASFFLGNDSGPAHIAAAFGVPLVAIFGPSDATTWAPWRTHAEVVDGRGSMAGVSVEAVLAAIDRLEPGR